METRQSISGEDKPNKPDKNREREIKKIAKAIDRADLFRKFTVGDILKGVGVAGLGGTMAMAGCAASPPAAVAEQTGDVGSGDETLPPAPEIAKYPQTPPQSDAGLPEDATLPDEDAADESGGEDAEEGGAYITWHGRQVLNPATRTEEEREIMRKMTINWAESLLEDGLITEVDWDSVAIFTKEYPIGGTIRAKSARTGEWRIEEVAVLADGSFVSPFSSSTPS
jgi:hypothetical protein